MSTTARRVARRTSIISLKRDANPNVVLNNLYKLTQLQTSFGVNMVALVDGVPRTLNLADALNGYIRHQVDVITRRSEYRLERARRRAHLVEGRLKALDVIDAVIALIRASDDPGAAKAGLMAEPFEFSELQAIDILEMQLRQLTRLSRIDLEMRAPRTSCRIAAANFEPTPGHAAGTEEKEGRHSWVHVRHAARSSPARARSPQASRPACSHRRPQPKPAPRSGGTRKPTSSAWAAAPRP